MLNFWGPKKDKKVINSSTKCLISVKIAIMTPHIIPLPLVNVWLIFDLQKYVNWLCVFSKVNPFFQKAQVFCMDLQPAADPYNVVCRGQPPKTVKKRWSCGWKTNHELFPEIETWHCQLTCVLFYTSRPIFFTTKEHLTKMRFCFLKFGCY